MLAVDQKLIEREIDKLTFYISPINRSNERRKQVVTFIQKILANTIGEGGCVVECGSSSLKSYLPDGDLDLVIFVPSNCNTNTSPGREDLKCLTAVFNTWCEEIADREEGKSQHHDMVIRNVEFVNARTKLAHCRINNIAVDVTINQIGALLTVTFLEEADRFIGMDHLFKRSLLVIKNWCQHESANYCGVPILGAKSGMLSSYAVSVIVLHIFNKYANLEHPFSVLRSFLFIFRNFPWDAQILTLDGSVPLSSAHSIGGNSYDSSSSAGSGSSSSSTGSTGVNTNIFRTIQQELSRHPALRAYRDAAMALHHGRFNAKSCNIQDPMDPLNNLGISVPRGNLKSIGQACQRGFHRLENLLTKHAAILQHHQQQQQQFQQHQQQQRQRADSNGVLEGNTSGGYNDFGNASNITHRTYNNDNNSHNNDNNNSNNVINNAVMYNVDENMVTAQHIHSASTVNVRQMLQPVPPVNLGYLGNPPPAGVAPPQQQHQPTSSNSNNNNNHTNIQSNISSNSTAITVSGNATSGANCSSSIHQSSYQPTNNETSSTDAVAGVGGAAITAASGDAASVVSMNSTGSQERCTPKRRFSIGSAGPYNARPPPSSSSSQQQHLQQHHQQQPSLPLPLPLPLPMQMDISSSPSSSLPPFDFLSEFFPVSMGLYRSADSGQALRSDLLTHPLQPLNTVGLSIPICHICSSSNTRSSSSSRSHKRFGNSSTNGSHYNANNSNGNPNYTPSGSSGKGSGDFGIASSSVATAVAAADTGSVLSGRSEGSVGTGFGDHSPPTPRGGGGGGGGGGYASSNSGNSTCSTGSSGNNGITECFYCFTGSHYTALAGDLAAMHQALDWYVRMRNTATTNATTTTSITTRTTRTANARPPVLTTSTATVAKEILNVNPNSRSGNKKTSKETTEVEDISMVYSAETSIESVARTEKEAEDSSGSSSGTLSPDADSGSGRRLPRPSSTGKFTTSTPAAAAAAAADALGRSPSRRKRTRSTTTTPAAAVTVGETVALDPTSTTAVSVADANYHSKNNRRHNTNSNNDNEQIPGISSIASPVSSPTTSATSSSSQDEVDGDDNDDEGEERLAEELPGDKDRAPSVAGAATRTTTSSSPRFNSLAPIPLSTSVEDIRGNSSSNDMNTHTVAIAAAGAAGGDSRAGAVTRNTNYDHQAKKKTKNGRGVRDLATFNPNNNKNDDDDVVGGGGYGSSSSSSSNDSDVEEEEEEEEEDGDIGSPGGSSTVTAGNDSPAVYHRSVDHLSLSNGTTSTNTGRNIQHSKEDNNDSHSHKAVPITALQTLQGKIYDYCIDLHVQCKDHIHAFLANTTTATSSSSSSSRSNSSSSTSTSSTTTAASTSKLTTSGVTSSLPPDVWLSMNNHTTATASIASVTETVAAQLQDKARRRNNHSLSSSSSNSPRPSYASHQKQIQMAAEASQQAAQSSTSNAAAALSSGRGGSGGTSSKKTTSSSTAIAAAAATSRRNQNRRNNSLITWLRRLWLQVVGILEHAMQTMVRLLHALLQPNSWQNRPLLIALFYCIVMIVSINVAIKVGSFLSSSYFPSYYSNSASSFEDSSSGGADYSAYFRPANRTALAASTSSSSSRSGVHLKEGLNAWVRNMYSRVSGDLTSGGGDGKVDVGARHESPSVLNRLSDGSSTSADLSVSGHPTKKEKGKKSSVVPDREETLQTLDAAAAASSMAPVAAATHWVRAGDSISFGDFSDYGNPYQFQQPLLGVGGDSGGSSSGNSNSGVYSSDSPGSQQQQQQQQKQSSYAADSTMIYGGVDDFEFDPLVPYSASTYWYQWTKDGSNVTNHYGNQPYFTIKKTKLKDAGHYRCWKYRISMTSLTSSLVVAAAPELVAETVIRISSKFLQALA